MRIRQIISASNSAQYADTDLSSITAGLWEIPAFLLADGAMFYIMIKYMAEETGEWGWGMGVGWGGGGGKDNILPTPKIQDYKNNDIQISV